MKSRSIVELVTNSYNEVELLRLKMFNSLIDSIEKSGGNPDIIVRNVLENNMTVLELIDILGQNNIEFLYIK